MGSKSHNRKSLVRKWSKCSGYSFDRMRGAHQSHKESSTAERKRGLEELRLRWAQELKNETFEKLPGWRKTSQDKIETLKVALQNGLTVPEAAEEAGISKQAASNYRRELFGKSGWRSHLKPLPPEYVRRQIPYEFETEVKMLSWRWGCYSMDEARGETERSFHDTMSSREPNPLEILCEEECLLDNEEFQMWLRAWIKDLSPRSCRVAEDLMAGDPVTQDDILVFKAEALVLFSNEHRELAARIKS